MYVRLLTVSDFPCHNSVMSLDFIRWLRFPTLKNTLCALVYSRVLSYARVLEGNLSVSHASPVQKYRQLSRLRHM